MKRKSRLTAAGLACLSAAIGLSISGMSRAARAGVNSVSQTNASATGFLSGTLNGSAAQVLAELNLTGQASAQLQNDLANLYVAIIARSCDPSKRYCTQVPASVPALDTVGLLQRSYVKPGSARGANPNQLVSPRLIH